MDTDYQRLEPAEATHNPCLVALNLVFPDKKTQDDYQVHALHIEFLEKVFKRVCKRVVVYDFE